jgi:hypothetical protein
MELAWLPMLVSVLAMQAVVRRASMLQPRFSDLLIPHWRIWKATVPSSNRLFCSQADSVRNRKERQLLSAGRSFAGI